MHLKHLKIKNFKSFYGETEFNFAAGFNVLLGANSSGKSSILESIAFHEISDVPHRSVLNSEDSEQPSLQRPEVELRFAINVTELRKLTSPAPHVYVGIGAGDGNSFYTTDINAVNDQLATGALDLDIKRGITTGQFCRVSFTGWPSTWQQLGGNSRAINFARLDQSEVPKVAEISGVMSNQNQLSEFLQKVQRKIYKFSSERKVQPICLHTNHNGGELLPDGANLAFCINNLQTNRKVLFDRINHLLQRIFPTIYWVGAPASINGQNTFELKVHTTPPDLNREDLAVPINQVGTGVGNALAMLYVVLTAPTPRIILLEEPNSFLHPRALRELLSILAEHGSQHQYFITTHSSDVLRTVNASTVTLLEHDGQQTTAKQTTGQKLHDLKAGLVELGISLTDLHGCDKVLWVEGETEEAVFPQLLRKYLPEQAQGIAVLPLYATGDFESRKYNPKKVAEIYKRLSSGSFLAPPMVAIALDREQRKDSEIAQIEKECAGIVHFLPEAILEDYFLHAGAIQAVLEAEIKETLAPQTVAEALSRVLKSSEVLLNPRKPKSAAVHAAKVLKAVFLELGTIEYHKTAHGPRIVEWLLVNAPEHLQPLEAWLRAVMQEKA